MRRTKEEAEQTRRDLLKAALMLFSSKGYESIRLADIAGEVGVTRGAIYHHFGGKEELFLALLDDAVLVGTRAVQQAVSEGGTLLQIITRILVYSFNLLEEDERFRQVTALSFANSNLEELARRKYQEASMLVESLRPPFQGGIESGELRSDLDPDTAVRAMLAYQNGLSMLWFANQDAFSIKDDAGELAEIYLYGIARDR